MGKILMKLIGTAAVLAAAVVLGGFLLLLNLAGLQMTTLTVLGFILLPLTLIPLI